MISELYQEDIKKPLAFSMVDQFEKAGYSVRRVDHLKFIAEGNFLRVGYKIAHTEFGFITNEPVFIRVKPKHLTDD